MQILQRLVYRVQIDSTCTHLYSRIIGLEPCPAPNCASSSLETEPEAIITADVVTRTTNVC
jgi:hypothetical protein